MNGSKSRAAVLGLALLFIVVAGVGCRRSKPPRTGAALAVATPAPATTASAASATPTSQSPATATATVTAAPPPTDTPGLTVVATMPATAAPTPTATALLPTPMPTGEVTYTVRERDTLMSIAARHQTTAAAIAARNGLADPNSISVGQTLVIPVGGATSETPGTSTVRHVVKGGETLSQIARTYRTTPKDILAANSTITDPDHLQVGSVLTITVGSAPAARTHRVRAGESLASIARRYGITIEALAQANGLSNPNRVRVGQVLVIP